MFNHEYLLYILLTATLIELTSSVNVTKCCDENQVWSKESGKCFPSDNYTSQSHFTPKIYSIEAEAFVNEEIKIAATGIPSCSTSEKLQSVIVDAGDDEAFVIISDDNSLFLASDTSTHEEYCINNIGDENVLVALFCVEDSTKVCKIGIEVTLKISKLKFTPPLLALCLYSINIIHITFSFSLHFHL